MNSMSIPVQGAVDSWDINQCEDFVSGFETYAPGEDVAKVTYSTGDCSDYTAALLPNQSIEGVPVSQNVTFFAERSNDDNPYFVIRNDFGLALAKRDDEGNVIPSSMIEVSGYTFVDGMVVVPSDDFSSVTIINDPDGSIQAAYNESFAVATYNTEIVELEKYCLTGEFYNDNYAKLQNVRAEIDATRARISDDDRINDATKTVLLTRLNVASSVIGTLYTPDQVLNGISWLPSNEVDSLNSMSLEDLRSAHDEILAYIDIVNGMDISNKQEVVAELNSLDGAVEGRILILEDAGATPTMCADEL